MPYRRWCCALILVAILVGLGAHDVYVAGQVYQRALAAGRGHRVRLRHDEER